MDIVWVTEEGLADELNPNMPFLRSLVKSAGHTIVVVSRPCVDTQLVPYHIRIALEKRQKNGQTPVMLVLIEISKEQTKEILTFGFARNATVIHADVNRDLWDARLIKDILNNLKTGKKVSTQMIT